MKVAGAVLAGGASRRMGTPKALLDVGGSTMLERVAAALAGAGCEPILVVGEPTGIDRLELGALAARHGWELVADRWPGEGPLGGIITALGAAAGTVVVAACDLPALDAETVRSLLHASDLSGDIDVVVTRTDRLQPLLARWEPSAAPVLERAFEAGERRMEAALSGLRVVEAAIEPARLRNVNTPADLDAARRDRPVPGAER